MIPLGFAETKPAHNPDTCASCIELRNVGDAALDAPMAEAVEEEARKQAMQDYADYVEGYPDGN